MCVQGSSMGGVQIGLGAAVTRFKRVRLEGSLCPRAFHVAWQPPCMDYACTHGMLYHTQDMDVWSIVSCLISAL